MNLAVVLARLAPGAWRSRRFNFSRSSPRRQRSRLRTPDLVENGWRRPARKSAAVLCPDDRFGGGEFLAAVSQDRILDLSGQAVQSHRQGLLLQVGLEVHGRGWNLSHQGASIVLPSQLLAHDLHQSGLGPVGNECDCVDKMLLSRAQLFKFLAFEQIFNL